MLRKGPTHDLTVPIPPQTLSEILMRKDPLLSLTSGQSIATSALLDVFQSRYSNSTAYSYLCALRSMLRAGVQLDEAEPVRLFHAALCAEQPARGRRLHHALVHVRRTYGLMVGAGWGFLTDRAPGRPQRDIPPVDAAAGLYIDFEKDLLVQGIKPASAAKTRYHCERVGSLIGGRNVTAPEATAHLSPSYKMQLLTAWGRFARWVVRHQRESESESMSHVPSGATRQLIHKIGFALRLSATSTRVGRYERLEAMTWAEMVPLVDEHSGDVRGMRLPLSGASSDWGPDGTLTRAVELFGPRAMGLLAAHHAWACPLSRHDPLFPHIPKSGKVLSAGALREIFREVSNARKGVETPGARKKQASVTASKVEAQSDRPIFADAEPIADDYDMDPGFEEDDEAITAFRNAALQAGMSRISSRLQETTEAEDAAERERLISEIQ